MKKVWLLIVIFLALVGISAAEDCNTQPKSTGEFLSQISDMNAKLDTCNSSALNSFAVLLRTETMNFQIFMQDSSKENFVIVTNSGKVTEVKEGFSEKPTYVIGMGECEFDTLLRSSDKAGVFRYLYDQKKLIVTPVGFWNKIKFQIIMIVAKVTIKSASDVEIACSTETGEASSKKKVGETCDNGGQCETGNCVGVGQGPPWTYKCSCNAFRFEGYASDGKCAVNPSQPEQGTNKKVGETCNHGGECQTGNCIGVIPGQLYKCSCDAFKYVESDTSGKCPNK